VQFEDGDGNPIPGASSAALDQTGSASLAGLNLNTTTGLPQFLITLQAGSQAPQEVKVQLTWTGLADQACEGGGLTVAPPTNPTLSPTVQQPTNPPLTGVTVAKGGGSGTAGASESKKKSSSLLSKAAKAGVIAGNGVLVGVGYTGCGALIGVSVETLGLSDIAASIECGFDADATIGLGLAGRSISQGVRPRAVEGEHDPFQVCR
jgi:hypothetical protein